MQNFQFYNPTKIVFGTDTISKLDKLVPNNARILILYGGSSAEKTGTLDEVKAALGKREVHLFGGIEPNPTYETLIKAVELIRHEKLDFLLAVGGGSVIDGTKFVAAAVSPNNYKDDPWEIAQTGGAHVKEALPLASVLTLPATGSEMNYFSVVTRAQTKTKLGFQSKHVFPVFSILDPTKTYTLPAKQVVNGVIDTFIHITEQYLTFPAQGMVQDKFSEGLLQILIDIGPKLLKNPEDYDLRANMMWTATLGLNGLIGVGVPQDWATHQIGHELTALFGLDHGVTLAIVLPSLLTIKKDSKKGKLLQYAQRVWSITEGTDDEKVDQAILKTRNFFESLGVKTSLSAYGIDAAGIDKIVAQLETNGMVKLGEHQDITPAVSRQILEHCL